jgi:very-short-patch-repair endonuclease
MAAERQRFTYGFSGVGQGTRALTPLGPPVNGGKQSPSPLTGKVGEGFFKVALRPIEEIKSGDRVFSHDGLARRVRRVVNRDYSGPMIGLRTRESDQALWITPDRHILCDRRSKSYGADRSWKHVAANHFELARGMRKAPTNAERILWTHLRRNQLGVAFRRQHPIGPYIADFYSWDSGIVIEIDGDSHCSVQAKIYDKERTAYLEALGLTVLRFTNGDVERQSAEVLKTIGLAVGAVMPSEDHYREWRRGDSLRETDSVFVVALDPPRRKEAESLPVDGEGWGGVLPRILTRILLNNAPSTFAEPNGGSCV